MKIVASLCELLSEGLQRFRVFPQRYYPGKGQTPTTTGTATYLSPLTIGKHEFDMLKTPDSFARDQVERGSFEMPNLKP